MKGQFVFEFLVAGLLFFAIILYTINYMNTSVQEFKTGFYSERLQSKVVQVSETLINNRSSLGLVSEWPVFDNGKIYDFEASYCTGNPTELLKNFDLEEPMYFGIKTYNIKISVSYVNGTSILDCGTKPSIPESVQKASVERFGVLNNDIVNLKISVW